MPALLPLLAAGVPAFAQQTGFEVADRPIGELFDAIESRTSWRIFAPAGVDTLRVTARESSGDVEGLLRRALSGTDLRVKAAAGAIFILSGGRDLVTDLPGWYYSETPVKVGSGASSFVLEVADDHGADSQVRIYEVGNPEANPPGRVSLSGYVYDAATGEAVPGIMLRIEETNTVAISDGYGYYRFNLLPGRYEIDITGAGQADSKRQIQLYSEGKLDILTAEKIETLTAITVYGNRRDNVRQTTIGVERLSVGDIKNMPTSWPKGDVPG